MTGKDLIFRYSGTLLEEFRSNSTETLKGRLPKRIDRQIKQYNMYYRAAHNSLLALMAHADLMWKNSIKPMDYKSEEQIQDELGVDVSDQSLTESHLWDLRSLRRQYEDAKELCKQYKLIACGTFVTDPNTLTWSSMPLINAEALKYLDFVLNRNIKAINKILVKLDAINSQLENAVIFWEGVRRGA